MTTICQTMIVMPLEMVVSNDGNTDYIHPFNSVEYDIQLLLLGPVSLRFRSSIR
jgi:hypothetical protein